MYVELHSPILGIVVVLLLLICYLLTIKYLKYDVIDIIGYTVMFAIGIAGVFMRGVYPFL